MLLADGLGGTIERFAYRARWRSPPTRHRRRRRHRGGHRLGAAVLLLGGSSAGAEALTIEHITRIGADQAPDWPTGRGWRVTVEGEPSMVLDARIAVHGEDDTEQGCLGTAMHAVHAIAPVCAAEPGIRTFLDLPMITGRGVFGMSQRPSAARPRRARPGHRSERGPIPTDHTGHQRGHRRVSSVGERPAAQRLSGKP